MRRSNRKTECVRAGRAGDASVEGRATLRLLMACTSEHRILRGRDVRRASSAAPALIAEVR
jgi:hypothetical protein